MWKNSPMIEDSSQNISNCGLFIRHKVSIFRDNSKWRFLIESDKWWHTYQTHHSYTTDVISQKTKKIFPIQTFQWWHSVINFDGCGKTSICEKIWMLTHTVGSHVTRRLLSTRFSVPSLEVLDYISSNLRVFLGTMWNTFQNGPEEVFRNCYCSKGYCSYWLPEWSRLLPERLPG